MHVGRSCDLDMCIAKPFSKIGEHSHYCLHSLVMFNGIPEVTNFEKQSKYKVNVG